MSNTFHLIHEAISVLIKLNYSKTSDVCECSNNARNLKPLCNHAVAEPEVSTSA